MAVDPEAFDQPVVDYDFSKATTPAALIQQMASAGGFTATKFAEARSILAQMKTDIEQVDADPSKVTNWLSFPACLCATGTRGFFVEAIKRKMFNVVSTTCGTLDRYKEIRLSESLRGKNLRVSFPGDSSAKHALYTNEDTGERGGSMVDFMEEVKAAGNFTYTVKEISNTSLSQYSSSYTACKMP